MLEVNMRRRDLSNYRMGGSLALAVLLIGSGAAWAQSDGGAGAATSATAGATLATTISLGESSATEASDAVALGLTPPAASSNQARPGNRRKSSSLVFDETADAGLAGLTRNNNGLRTAPSLNTGFSAFSDLAIFTGGGRALGNVFASDSPPQAGGNGNGRALGLNADVSASDSVAATASQAGGNGIGRAVGLAVQANNLSAFNDSAIEARGHGHGKGHGRNADANSSESSNAGGNGKSKGPSLVANTLRRFDESSIAQVDSRNPVISETVGGHGRPTPSTPIVSPVLPVAAVSTPALEAGAESAPALVAAAAVSAPALVAALGASSPALEAAATAVPALTPAAVIGPALPTVAAIDDLSSPALHAAAPMMPVPEPSTWVLLALGLLALGARAMTLRR
jgi:hypothetical protein